MSVKLKTKKGPVRDIDLSRDLQTQLQEVQSVELDTVEIEKARQFLSTLEPISLTQILPDTEIKVDHANSIAGAQIKRKAKEVRRNILINNLIKEIAKSYEIVQNGLEDILEHLKHKRT